MLSISNNAQSKIESNAKSSIFRSQVKKQKNSKQMSNQKITFLHPDFDKNIPGKVDRGVEVKSKHTLVALYSGNESTATTGCDSRANNFNEVSVFATKIHEIQDGDLDVGFVIPDEKSSFLLGCRNGEAVAGGPRYANRINYLPESVSKTAREIISILTISNNGDKITIQWIVDGIEGRVAESKEHRFRPCHETHRGEVFPCISLENRGQRVQFIPFDHVRYRSPTINVLLAEYRNQLKQGLISSSSGKDENDEVILQLHEKIARKQDALMAEKDEEIRMLKKKFEHSWDMFYPAVELAESQLELERVEHQKTKTQLDRKTAEFKDMEIYYLTREKESGQIRQREEDKNDDAVKVKIEPGLEKDETEEINDEKN